MIRSGVVYFFVHPILEVKPDQEVIDHIFALVQFPGDKRYQFTTHELANLPLYHMKPLPFSHACIVPVHRIHSGVVMMPTRIENHAIYYTLPRKIKTTFVSEPNIRFALFATYRFSFIAPRAFVHIPLFESRDRLVASFSTFLAREPHPVSNILLLSHAYHHHHHHHQRHQLSPPMNSSFATTPILKDERCAFIINNAWYSST